jgi:hypothetical protein
MGKRRDDDDEDYVPSSTKTKKRTKEARKVKDRLGKGRANTKRSDDDDDNVKDSNAPNQKEQQEDEEQHEDYESQMMEWKPVTQVEEELELAADATTRFSNLPPELMLEIVLFLPPGNFNSYLMTNCLVPYNFTLRRLNKNFCENLQKVEQEHKFTDLNFWNVYQKKAEMTRLIKENSEHLRCLALISCSYPSDYLYELLKTCSNLNTLTLNSIDVRFDSLITCPAVERLNLFNTGKQDLISINK